jgi:molybdopterin molybdotransferase
MPSLQESQRIARLTPLAEVLKRVAALAHPVAAREMETDQSAGRVLASDAAVDGPLPSRPTALRDGWAVRSELVSDAGAYAPTVLEPAPEFLEAGDAAAPGSDAVLPPDALVMRGAIAEAVAGVAPGEGMLLAGADAEEGTPLRRAGLRLRPLDCSVLQSAGILRVWVREPRVLVSCATITQDAADVVGPLIVRSIDAAGGAARLVRAKRNMERFARMLEDRDADAVVTVGGTGEGRRDASVRALARVGKIELHGMGIRPGETAALGVVGERPILMLPGRLDAALAVWLAVGRPLLARLTGLREVEGGRPATLVRKLTSTIGLAEVVPVAACEGGVEPLASGYFPLHALARAEGWIMVPPDSEGYPVDSVVEVWPFP